MKKTCILLLFYISFLIPSVLFTQVLDQKVSFPSLSFHWKGSQIEFYDLTQKLLVKIDLTQKPKRQSLSEKLGEKIEEEDLGGTLKKQAPLASKNLKLRLVNEKRLQEKPNPVGKAVEVTKISKEGGLETTYSFSDGSKQIMFLAPTLKKEAFLNKKGALVYQSEESLEGELKVKKVTWEEGSKTLEYQSQAGFLLVLFDQETKRWNYSVLNSKKEMLAEIACEGKNCEWY